MFDPELNFILIKFDFHYDFGLILRTFVRMNKDNYVLIGGSHLLALEKKVEGILDKVSNSPSRKLCYTDDEVAHMFNVKKKTLAKYRSEGRLGYVKPENGRVILYKEQHVQDFLDSNEFKAFK